MPNDRTPRSMQEAFGAYHPDEIARPCDRMQEAWDQDDIPHDPMTLSDAALTVAMWCAGLTFVCVTVGYLYTRFST